MINKVERTVEKIGDKVYMFTKRVEDKSKGNRLVEITTINKTEVDSDIIKEYETDRKEQFNNFKLQEKDTIKKLKDLSKDYKKHSGERGYIKYKKNFQTYEMYEKFIEQNIKVDSFLTGNGLKDFKDYEKKRDTYKNFFVTMQQEGQIELLKRNIEAFKDIWEEDKLFVKQIKDAKKLLKK